MITFTTTSTIRPDILDQTYSSFSKNLLGVNLKNCKLVINVDPMPVEVLTNREKTLAVAKKYFGTVIHNFPEKANFPNALKWVWSNTDSPYIFNLEDDWTLLEKVNVNTLIDLHSKDKTSIGVSLNAYLFGVDPFRIRLSPCLLNGNWARSATTYLAESGCPERQLRTKIPLNLARKMLNYPEYSHPKFGKIIVRDTGRKWREARNLVKNNDGVVGFTSWKKN